MKLASLILFGAVGCGSATREPAQPETSAADGSKAKRLGTMCDRYYARERVCVDEYLSQLLDVRVEYDMPAGIKAELARDGRDAVLARMRPEWERDTTLENTNRMCRDVETQVPPDRMDALLADGERCYAEADCTGFVACTVESQRDYIKSGRAPH